MDVAFAVDSVTLLRAGSMFLLYSCRERVCLSKSGLLLDGGSSFSGDSRI